MSLDDRDWYRAEVDRRLPSARPTGEAPSVIDAVIAATNGMRPSAVPAVIAAAVIIAATVAVGLPVAMVAQCEVDGWSSKPLTCWRLSWAALSDRVAGNMTATRGWPFIIVQTPPQQPKLPSVITPSHR